MITINSLSKSYKTKRVLNEVSVEFGDNRIIFVMGENGSGKTTLMKCVTDIEEHYGEVRFDGKKIDEVRDNCVVLFDDCPFYNKMSGIQNLLLFSEGMKSKDEIRAIGEKYLDYDLLLSKVCHYSNGQRKKLGIALIECLEPKYIFLDEISNGLDYVSLKQLRSRINEWAGNATIVMTGHQFDFYNNLVDELYILKDGIVLKETGYEKGIDRLEQSGDMSS